MKKSVSKNVFSIFFFLFSITLFSSEITRARVTKIPVEEGELSQPSNKIITDFSDNSSLNDTESKTQDMVEKVQDEEERNMEVQKEAEDDNKDKDATENKQKENVVAPSKEDEKISSKDDDSDEFSSIQMNGLTVANGNRWYFEEYDEYGNIIGKISYDNNKMIFKSNIEYDNGKKKSEMLTERKKITKISYNDKGVEISREEYQNKKGQLGKSLNAVSNVYNDNGKIKEEVKTENGITVRRVYEYEKDKKVSETIYENDIKTIFIEYKEEKKIVHIFDEGLEINVFEEAVE